MFKVIELVRYRVGFIFRVYFILVFDGWVRRLFDRGFGVWILVLILYCVMW